MEKLLLVTPRKKPKLEPPLTFVLPQTRRMMITMQQMQNSWDQKHFQIPSRDLTIAGLWAEEKENQERRWRPKVCVVAVKKKI